MLQHINNSGEGSHQRHPTPPTPHLCTTVGVWLCVYVRRLTSPVTRNLEVWHSTVLSETPKKNEASATECWRTWTNHKTCHRRSSLHGAGIVDYLRWVIIYHQYSTSTVPFGRTISVRQLPFPVLSDNLFWNAANPFFLPRLSNNAPPSNKPPFSEEEN